MRLTTEERQTIVHAVRTRFGEGARVLLFGSRTDDSKRGGDIDLLVESDLATEAAFDAKIDTLVDIKLAIGDRKIDLVVASPESQSLVVDIARAEGIPL